MALLEEPRGPIYAATFSAVAIAAAQDVFEITAPSTGFVVLREIRLGNYSIAGDANAEMLSVLVLVGYTTTGSGGTTLTPANVVNWTASGGSDVLGRTVSRAPLVASSVVKANNTTVAANGSPVTVLADTMNVAGGFRWYPGFRGERFVLDKSQRAVVRITLPSISFTGNGTLLFQEIGTMLP